MNNLLGTLGMLAAAVIGFLVGKKSVGVHGPSNADATFFQTTPGSDGFVDADILKRRMKGRTFHWNRVGVRPEIGSHFEIRPKFETSSILVPPIPKGVDSIFADVEQGVRAGTIYKYSLWQVLSDGRERELQDPELEVGHV